MTYSPTRIAFAVALALTLTACGTGTASPLGAPAAGTASKVSNDATIRNLSGQYAGSVKDSKYNKGSVTASFAQYQTSVGGDMTPTEGSRSSTMSVSFSVASGTTFTGTAAATVGSAVCVYNIAAVYNSSTHNLKGTYQAAHGCSGESGSFKMKQKCFYAKPGADADIGGLKMC